MAARSKARKRALDLLFEAEVRGQPVFALIEERSSLGADGGLSLGLAFLSDIQVFMFMEAAQGDRRVQELLDQVVTLARYARDLEDALDHQQAELRALRRSVAGAMARSVA